MNNGISIAEKHLDMSIDLMNEAFKRYKSHSQLNDVKRLATIIFQCDALKASALAFATEIDFLKKQDE